MKKILFFFLLVLIMEVNTGCPKPCIEANYSFAVQSQITPDRDSVNVGDTIYLLSNTPTTMKDLSTGTNADYRGATIGNTLSIGELIPGNTFPRDAVFDFDYMSIKGKVYNDKSVPSPDGIQQLTYEETNGNYVLQIAIIPKKKGVYGFGLGNGFSMGRNKKNVCEKASFNMSFANTSQHFYFYQEFYPSHQITDYESKHGYFFKVQ